jgi:hypothetical protein
LVASLTVASLVDTTISKGSFDFPPITQTINGFIKKVRRICQKIRRGGRRKIQEGERGGEGDLRRHNVDSTAKAEEIVRDCRFIFLADYYMLTFLYTGAKGAWSENRVDTAGYMFVAEGVHAGWSISQSVSHQSIRGY